MAAVASSGGCCTLVVDEEIPPFYVKCFEYPEKLYINVTNYYYYKYLPFFFSPFFVTFIRKGFINLVWLYCSDNSQNQHDKESWYSWSWYREKCSCGSVVRALREQRKGCGFDSQGTHTKKKKKCINVKSLWIKASAKCINVKKIVILHFSISPTPSAWSILNKD